MPSFYNSTTKSIILISVVITLVFLASSLTYTFKNVEARCPNGTHKSPSGKCETFVPHKGLPRCPNGTHRSPDGSHCEKVVKDSNEGSKKESKGDNDNNKVDKTHDSSSSSKKDTTFYCPADAKCFDDEKEYAKAVAKHDRELIKQCKDPLTQNSADKQEAAAARKHYPQFFKFEENKKIVKTIIIMTTITKTMNQKQNYHHQQR